MKRTLPSGVVMDITPNDTGGYDVKVICPPKTYTNLNEGLQDKYDTIKGALIELKKEGIFSGAYQKPRISNPPVSGIEIGSKPTQKKPAPPKQQPKPKQGAKVIYSSPSPKPAYVWEPNTHKEPAPLVLDPNGFTPEEAHTEGEHRSIMQFKKKSKQMLKENHEKDNGYKQVKMPETYSGNFEKYVTSVLITEGGYVDDSDDAGKQTNKGITIGTFHDYAQKDLGMEPTLDNLEKLSLDQAKIIYKKEYWDKIKGDQIKNGSLAYAIFDFYVNSQAWAIKILQETLNLQGAQLKVDGGLGMTTLNAINNTDSQKLFNAYKQGRKTFLLNYIKHKPSQMKYKKSWFDRIDKITFVEE